MATRLITLARTIGREVTKLERHLVVLFYPIAAGVTVLVAVIVCDTYDSPQSAIPFAIGATLTPLVSTREASPRRTLTYLWALVWITLSVLISSLLSQDTFTLAIVGVIASAIYGFACGVVGRISANARITGVVCLAFFAIYLGSPETRLGALESTALVALGGLVQIIILTIWSLRREPIKDWQLTQVTPSVWKRLSAGWSRDDLYVEHGLRLGAAMATGTALSLLLATTFDWPHQYWLPMTIAWVLLPEAAATTVKTFSRVAGTLIGVTFIGFVVLVLIGSEPILRQAGLLAGFGTFLALAFIAANYAAATTGITIFAMSIFTLVNDPVGSTLVYRIALTVFAAIIAILFAQLWHKRDASQPS